MPGSLLPNFADASTFLRCPRATLSDVKGGMVVVVGLPHDSTAASRPGARWGPAAIRAASAEFDYFLSTTERGEMVDVETGDAVAYLDPSPLIDIGDSMVFPLDQRKTVESVAPVISEIVASGAFPVVLGGDHFVSLASATGFVRGVCHRHEDARVGYIHIDADLDISAQNPTWGAYFHGTNARRVAELEAISPKNMVMVGISGSTRVDQWDFVRSSEITVLTLGYIRRHGVDAAMREAINIATDGVQATYVTCDIDVLDGAYAPGTGGIKFEGLTPPELFTVGEMLSEAPIGGIDLVEVAPNWDPTGRTQTIAASFLTTALGSRVFSKRSTTRIS